jgi:hypothetical protein
MNTEIIEGNKLIAHSPFASDQMKAWVIKAEKRNELDQLYERLKYHSSWDWLMDVWAKLRETVWYGFHESYPNDFLKLYVENFKTACFNNSTLDARNAVLDAIKWYRSMEGITVTANTQTK